MVIPNAIALFALSGAVLAIANAKHDKRALDAAEERLEDQDVYKRQSRARPTPARASSRETSSSRASFGSGECPASSTKQVLKKSSS